MQPLVLPQRSFFSVRHGATDWNLSGRFQGRSDIALNQQGQRQAQELARSLQSIAIDLVVTSPMVRAIATAECVASTLDKPLHVEPKLIECDFGTFEGALIRDVMEKFGVVRKDALPKILPPDAESWTSVKSRSLQAICEWLSRCSDKNVLFVGHDAVMQSVAEALCGSWFENLHGKVYEFKLDSASWRIVVV